MIKCRKYYLNHKDTETQSCEKNYLVYFLSFSVPWLYVLNKDRKKGLNILDITF